jgi:hypothetical protein
MALAVVGALLMASFLRVIHAPLGFDADRLAYISVWLPRAMTATRAEFYDEALRRMTTIPGVESAALIDIPALRGLIRGTTLSPEGRGVPPSDRQSPIRSSRSRPGTFKPPGCVSWRDEGSPRRTSPTLPASPS